AVHAFPPFFLHLIDAGEQSGSLDRTLDELGRFYEFQRRLKLTFISQAVMPALQYVAAVAIVALATHIISILGEAPSGGGRVLLFGYGIPVVLVLAYYALLRPIGATRVVHELLLAVPVLGGVFRSLALARFSLVMYLMWEAGVPVREALQRSLEGTGNAAFAARAPRAVKAVEEGTVTEALKDTGLFPVEYLNIVAIGEESGKLSERLQWLASHHAEQAERALRALVVLAARLIYVLVACIIIYFIVTFFMRYATALMGAAGR
ncbi:MAG: type II secretion system F family protein, partial [Planctomycetota bacterium]